MYAYQLARCLRGFEDIRIISLGTSSPPYVPISDPSKFNKVTALESTSEMMMNIDIFTAHNYLKWQFASEGK
jgi:hypothetical protein